MGFARTAVLALSVAAGSGVWQPPARAQELEPRSFANTPVGLNFLISTYGYLDGNVVLGGNSPVEDAEVQSHTGTVAYIRAIDVAGMSGKVAAIVPFARTSGTATLAGEPQERSISGFGDPRLRLSVNFIGAPALSLAEFQHYRQDLIVGATAEISAPLGQYDSDKLLNIGANRWSLKTQVGASKALGPVTIETSIASTFFSTNTDFLGGQTLDQDPLIAAQGHLIYQFRRGLWGSVDGTYYMGGRTTVDGEAGDSLRNARLGLTMSMDLSRYTAVKVFGGTSIYSRTGVEFDSIGIAWQARWGGGL
jgi:hypothetical protein